MNKYFLPKISALILFLSVMTLPGMAQDTVKKVVAAKKTVATKTTSKTTAPAAVNGVPINPKTGRPYTRYGYGAYTKNKYNAAQAARKADSLKQAQAPSKPIITATEPIATAPPIATVPPAPVDKSLNAQYQYLLTKVYNYQQPFVAALWKNVMDTLNTNRRKLKDVESSVTTQNKTITDLQAEVASKEASLTASDTIDLAGITLPKSTYNLIMWGLVIVFGAVAVLVIARSGSNKSEAAYRTQLYNELEEEFKAYKAKANEKEKKLARELQTERNKVDELMGRG